MSQPSRPKELFHREAQQAARSERAIQRHIDHIDQRRPKKKESNEPMQAGQREYPATFPPQHLQKPGHETELEQPPMYEAPAYEGSNKLKDRVALITGADSGIGRAIAVLYAREGADVVVAYLDEHEDAKVTQAAVQAEGRRCITLSGDVANLAFCEMAVAETIKAFGKIEGGARRIRTRLHSVMEHGR